MARAAAAAKVWSAVGQGDAFVHWREVVCQAYTQLVPERVEDGPFAGEIRLFPLGEGGSVSRISASPQSVSRGRREIAASPCDAVFVNIQVSGESVLRQCESETRLVPGSFALLDARRPFAMRFDGAFRQLCLHLPMASLEARGLDPAGIAARRIDRRSAYGAVFLDHMTALFAPGKGEAASAALAEHLAHLLELAYGDGAPETLADRHLALLQRFVAVHCADPALAPAAVAAHFRISKRYLHKLFARSGESFGRFLLRCRLDRSHAAILDRRDRSILEIALASGFQDASHFARTFRRRFGTAPSHMRSLPHAALRSPQR
ncbi:MAG: helix-turn-helix domain-containing protein [Alphaproteobacteria bacterium]